MRRQIAASIQSVIAPMPLEVAIAELRVAVEHLSSRVESLGVAIGVMQVEVASASVLAAKETVRREELTHDVRALRKAAAAREWPPTAKATLIAAGTAAATSLVALLAGLL